jgi:hypothetical protein
MVYRPTPRDAIRLRGQAVSSPPKSPGEALDKPLGMFHASGNRGGVKRRRNN